MQTNVDYRKAELLFSKFFLCPNSFYTILSLKSLKFVWLGGYSMYAHFFQMTFFKQYIDKNASGVEFLNAPVEFIYFSLFLSWGLKNMGNKNAMLI